MNDLKKEDGYILVVVIGILTILSLMTITFATLSRIETRATRNYADSVKCEMVAKAGLEHAIYELRLDKFGTDTTAYNNDNGDENYDASGDASWPGNSVFPGTDYDNDGKFGSESAWIYLPGASTATSAIRLPGNLLARYAVLITDDREARVNINVSGDQPGDEGTSTTEIDMSSVIELALGLSPADGDNIASDIISKRSTMPFGILTEAEIIGIAGTSTAYTSRLEESFEAYIGAYEDRKGTLTAFSADTIVCPPYTLGTSTSTTMLNINALIYNEGAYTDTDIYDTNKKVSMIVDVLTKEGVPDVERQQLAVNIVDFIDNTPVDPIGTVTTYSVGTNTYYGVEKTPYINEVEAWTSSGTNEFIELFNPYDTDINIAGWEIWQDGGATIITLTGPTILSQDYYVIADLAGAGVDQVDAAGINDLDNGGEQLTLKTDLGSGSITVQVTNYGSANQNDTCSLNDPRPTPLTATPLDPWNWTTNSSNTIGAQNSNFNPTVVGGDGWDNTTWPNSFLIANRRFSNKGYMGFIHRGSEWSSVKIDDSYSNQNVLQYITIIDPSMDGIDNDGDFGTDTYDTDGDGDIDANDTGDTGFQAGDIDGKEYRIFGLINVNTASAEVLKSLPVIGTMTAATDIANGSKPYDSINDLLVKITSITDTSATNNKWNREKRFRAISNLITMRSNVFTIYVTAQVTDEAFTVFAEKRILAIVDRSVDPIRVRYFRWIVE